MKNPLVAIRCPAPSCRLTIKDVNLADGWIVCPYCAHQMWQYRQPGDENLTPAEYAKLIDTRGIELGHTCANKWMTGQYHKRMIAGALFVTFVWPHLAGTFARPELTEGATYGVLPEPHSD